MGVDTLSPDERSERMSRIRSRDTNPEMAVRRLTYGLGYRYRLHTSDLPGRPDLVFRSRRKAIFVHGCYWHRHDCPSGRREPKSNRKFWIPKLNGNRDRDRENQHRLRKMGWDVLTVWACESADTEDLTQRITSFLDDC